MQSYLKDKPIEFEYNIEDKYFFEMCRFTNSRLAPIASIIGSVASQEILKLITYQFLTVNSTIIFNGIHSRTTNFSF